MAYHLLSSTLQIALRIYVKARLLFPPVLYDPIRHSILRLNNSIYIHLFGSLGDQYYVISILGHLISCSSRPLRVLAETHLYFTLLLFYSDNWIKQNVVFISPLDRAYILALCQRSSRPYSHLHASTSPATEEFLIYSPFICSDSSLRRSVCLGAVSYTAALLSFLNLESCHIPSLNLSKPLSITLSKSLQYLTPSRRAVLYFPVNHTHQSLSHVELLQLSSLCKASNIDLFFNISGASASLASLLISLGRVVRPRHHEIPSLSSKFTTIAGVSGGGLCVAEACSHSFALILITPYNNHTWDDIDPSSVTYEQLCRIHLFELQITKAPKDRSKTTFYIDHNANPFLPSKSEFINDIVFKTLEC